MKKWAIAWGIVAAVALIIGAVLFVIGMSNLNWQFMELDTLTYTEVNKSAEEVGIQETVDIKAFVYDGFDWNINISKGDTFSIKYYTTEQTTKAEVAFNEESGTVSFHYDEDWFSGIAGFKGIKKINMAVEVVIPENIDLSLHSTNLGVNIADMNVGKIAMNGTNSTLNLSNLTVGDISIKGTNTDLDMTDCTAANISADSTNCDVTLKRTTGNAVTVTGTNIDFDIEGGGFNSIASDGTNNDVKIEGSVISEKLVFSGTNLDIVFRTENKLEDFKSISVTGTNRKLRINDEKYSEGYTSETGTLVFEAKATNAGVRIYTAA